MSAMIYFRLVMSLKNGPKEYLLKAIVGEESFEFLSYYCFLYTKK